MKLTKKAKVLSRARPTATSAFREKCESCQLTLRIGAIFRGKSAGRVKGKYLASRPRTRRHSRVRVSLDPHRELASTRQSRSSSRPKSPQPSHARARVRHRPAPAFVTTEKEDVLHDLRVRRAPDGERAASSGDAPRRALPQDPHGCAPLRARVRQEERRDPRRAQGEVHHRRCVSPVPASLGSPRNTSNSVNRNSRRRR